MALAQRRVGSLGTAPALLTAQTLAVAGCYPGPGRLRIDGVGVSDCVSNGRLIDTFWCVMCPYLSPPLLSPKRQSHPERVGRCPRAVRARTATGCVRAIRVNLPVLACPTGLRPEPAQATPRLIRVEGLGGPGAREAAPGAGTGTAGRCAGCNYCNWHDAEAVRPTYPAQLAGWVSAWINSDNVRRVET